MEMMLYVQITRQLTDLVSEATQSSSLPHGHYVVCCLRDLAAVLTQYSRLVQFFLTQHVAAVRTMAKLLSILLSIFATIAQKVGNNITKKAIVDIMTSFPVLLTEHTL